MKMKLDKKDKLPENLLMKFKLYLIFFLSGKKRFQAIKVYISSYEMYKK